MTQPMWTLHSVKHLVLLVVISSTSGPGGGGSTEDFGSGALGSAHMVSAPSSGSKENRSVLRLWLGHRAYLLTVSQGS